MWRERYSRTLQSIKGNIEQALSRLASFKPWLSEAENWREKALFLDIANAVRVVLERQTEQAIALLHCDAPPWMVSLIQRWHQQQATVVSLNYDTLIEQIASEVLVSLFTGRNLDLQQALQGLDRERAKLVLGIVADYLAGRFDFTDDEEVRAHFGRA